MRDLNRVELRAETLRAALNAIPAVAADWLQRLAGPKWHKRYDRRVEEARLPRSGPKRDAYVAQVGTDGFGLLDTLAAPNARPAAARLPAVAVLRRVWERHFERLDEDRDPGEPPKVQVRSVQGRSPGDRIESPYHVDVSASPPGSPDVP